MSSIFVSYASADRPFVLRLANSLGQLGHSVWIDADMIDVGDAIPRRIAKAVENADFLVAVLSRQSATSSWSQHEWEAKLWEEIDGSRARVLPVLLEDCEIPFFLRPKRHADFRSDYALGLAQLTLALRDTPQVMAIQRAGADSHSIEANFSELPNMITPVSQNVALCYADHAMKHFGQVAQVDVQLEVPYIGRISGVWKPDQREQDAAWELYVELTTRISVAELSPSDGLLRESLSSLYGIFTTTRQLLRTYGPTVARTKADSELSFGYLALSMLNLVLRPVLTKWHPLLLDYEHRRDASVSQLKHEHAWEQADELRHVLSQVRLVLIEYTKLLAQISCVPVILPAQTHLASLDTKA